MNNLKTTNSVFEDIKHIDENGFEYWSARELMKALEYTECRKFLPVINKAIISCKNSNRNKNNHFVDVNKMVNIGSNTSRAIKSKGVTMPEDLTYSK